jgi:hypothetical protein
MCDRCEQAARSTAPRWRGRYDRAAMRRACQELGVRRPVRVRCAESPVVRPGAPLPDEGIDFGEATMDGGEHVITVTRHLPLDVANRTMLHELAHCAQNERAPSFEAAMRQAALDEFRYGYRESPHEVDADMVADRLQDIYPIAR